MDREKHLKRQQAVHSRQQHLALTLIPSAVYIGMYISFQYQDTTIFRRLMMVVPGSSS